MTKSTRPYDEPQGWQWPPGDTHFPEDWQSYQRQSRHWFYSLSEQIVNFKDEPPYMPPSRLGILIDIGAHAGSWALDLAERYRYVIAYEPIHWATLSKNAEYLGVSNIQCRPRLLSDQEAERTFYQRLDNSGDSGIDLEDEHPRQKIEFQTQILDRDLEEVRTWLALKDIPWQIDSIKIDVQGHELEVVKGAEQTIRQHQPTICLELNDGYPELENLLKSWQYVLGHRQGKDWIWTPTIPD